MQMDKVEQTDGWKILIRRFLFVLRFLPLFLLLPLPYYNPPIA